MRKIIPLTVCAVSVLSVSGHAFSGAQHKVLDLAKAEGREAQFPETLQALALQESLAGKLGRLGDRHHKDWKKRSYGVLQVRFTTAKWILHRKFGHHIYYDGELLRRLTNSDRFNVFVARIYWEYLYNQFRGHKLRWSKAVLAYNVGIGNVLKHGLSFDPNKYLMNIQLRLKALRRHKDHGYRPRSEVFTPPYRSPFGF